MNKIFVYGTLKKAFSNHYLIGDKPVNKFVCDDVIGPFVMYSHGGFPFIVPEQPYPDALIKGEVYEVDDETLALLDKLEGHPRWYERQEVTTAKGEKVFTYVMPKTYLENTRRKYPIIESGDWQ